MGIMQVNYRIQQEGKKLLSEREEEMYSKPEETQINHVCPVTKG